LALFLIQIIIIKKERSHEFMNVPVTIITTGRVTADLELKTSQNGKNTKFVQFGLAVNRGYGENTHANFYNCIIYGDAAQRIIDAKVKKGSLIQIVGDQDIVEYSRKDGGTGWMAKITLLSWNYAPTNRPKESDAEGGEIPSDDYGFTSAENCGTNGLPFN
jgi:single-stranded DNA-binding protein